MKFGVTYSYWGKDWEGADYPQKIERARKCGLDVLEIFYGRILTMGKREIDEINAARKANEIEIYTLGGFGPEQDLSKLDESARLIAVEKAKELIRAISRLGTHNFSGINYSQWCGLSDSEQKARRFDASAKSLGEVGRYAADFGISWNMEVVNRFESYLVNTAAEARSLAEASGSKNVNILLDIFHGMLEEDDLAEAVRIAGDRLSHYHVGSNNRKLPRPSFQPWAEVAKAMKEIGYNKCISIEPLVHTGGSVALSGGNVWREMLPTGWDDAMLDRMLMESLAFLRRTFD